MSDYSDFKIDLGGKTGEVATLCPECSHTRKNKTARCLSVNTDKGVWICFHCGWKGGLKQGVEFKGRKIHSRPSALKPKPPTTLFELEVAHRAVPQAVLDVEGVALVSAYMPQKESHIDCIAFPYVKQGELVNVKYRGLAEKSFCQHPHAEKVFYRQDRIEKEQVYICEGEWDALSIVTAGIASVISVPDGAPAVNAKNYSAKFTYLDQDPDPFEGVQQIVLACDNDEPGVKLRDELARRLGMDRCVYVTWPEGCKDANDVLRIHGADTLRQCLTQCTHFPIEDVVMVGDLVDEVMAEYINGPRKGLETPWMAVNNFYTVDTGQLTIVTGIPSSGKSEWLDALCVGLAGLHEWRFAICSPENWPLKVHCEKYLEKVTGKPFRHGPTPRMTTTDIASGLQWLHDRFTFIATEEALTIGGVLERASGLVRRMGIHGLVIDPFNEFDHTRQKGQTETEYISDTLSLIKRWSRKHACHVWVVAHPQKLYRKEDGTYPVPTPYDISGSAHWRNKADNCITVHRHFDKPEKPVEIHFQKIRFKHIGKQGACGLIWDRVNGRYYDTPEWMNQSVAQGDSH